MMLPAQRDIDIIPNIPIKRELVTREPDPGQRLISLIGWLKKRGGVRTVSQCNIKWKRDGINIEEEIKKIVNNHLIFYSSLKTYPQKQNY